MKRYDLSYSGDGKLNVFTGDNGTIFYNRPLLASALVYLHISDFIHRVMKTNNPFLGNHFTIKLAVCRYASEWGLLCNTSVGTALVARYASVGAVCSQVSCHLDTLELLTKMCQNDVKPDVYTFYCVLNSIATSKCLNSFKEIYGAILKCGLGAMGFSASNGLVFAYVRCESLAAGEKSLIGKVSFLFLEDATDFSNVYLNYNLKDKVVLEGLGNDTCWTFDKGPLIDIGPSQPQRDQRSRTQ